MAFLFLFTCALISASSFNTGRVSGQRSKRPGASHGAQVLLLEEEAPIARVRVGRLKPCGTLPDLDRNEKGGGLTVDVVPV